MSLPLDDEDGASEHRCSAAVHVRILNDCLHRLAAATAESHDYMTILTGKEKKKNCITPTGNSTNSHVSAV